MKVRNLKLKSFCAFAAIAFITGIILNSIFLFSPIFFKKDNITPFDWYDYKKPIEVVYCYWDTNEGWKESNIIKSEKEAKFIIGELKEATIIEYRLEDYLIPFDKRGRECKVIIRRAIGKSEYWNMLEFGYYENGDIADFNGSSYIKLSKDLKSLLLSKIDTYRCVVQL